MINLNNNFEIESGFVMSIDISNSNFSKEFAILVLGAIHKGLEEEKDKLFPCNCDCINSCILDVGLFSDKVGYLSSEEYSFEYSLKTGFYPFHKIEQFYSRFQGFQEVSLLVQVNQICQE